MPRISTDNYDTVASWNGSQDLFVVEQPDGTKVATPAMLKQFIEAGDFEATGEVKDGHGNILKDMAKSADVANEIGDLSQTGLTGDSVSEQLETAGKQIADLNGEIVRMTKKNIESTDETDFLEKVFADIKAESNTYNNASIRHCYTWYSRDTYIVSAYRVSSTWIYATCFSWNRFYVIAYDCDNNRIDTKKTVSLS